MHLLFAAANLIGAYIVFLFLRTLYRLSPLHPLYKFPWLSRWAVISDTYGFYWNCHKGGQMVFRIAEAHKKYGPIVRIRHNELHVSDPSFHLTVYAVGSKYQVDHQHYMHSTMNDENRAGNLLDDAEYRKRRQAYNPMFSKTAINGLDHRIRKYVGDATSWLGKHQPDEPIDIKKMIRVLTIDIITEYAYGKSEGHLEKAEFDPPFVLAASNMAKSFWFFHYFPIIAGFMFRLPQAVVMALVPPEARGLMAMQDKVRTEIVKFLKDPEALKSEFTHKTVFEALIVDGPRDVKGYKLPHKEALTNEAWIILGAGFETTANVLTYGVFQAANNPNIQYDLYKELVSAFPNKAELTLPACEKLPLLTGFVKECLRLAPGAPGRLPRVVPASGAVVAGQTIKPGTSVSISSYVLHTDSTVFPNPHTFEPSRWLTEGEHGKLMERSLIAFSRGSRGCLGKNLAMAELYLCVATFVRTFEFGLHEKNTFEGVFTDHFVLQWDGELLITVKQRPE